jgi:hypothetical protein
MKKILVNQKELGIIIDISPKWIQELERRGVFKKKLGRYDLQESVTAYIIFLRGSRDKTLMEAQRIHLEVKTRKLQLEAEKLSGNLIEKTELQKQIDGLIAGCEDAFRNLPYRLAPVLAMIPDKENDQKLIALILRHEIANCWRDLAGYPKNETPIVLPGETILVCLGLIQGDANGEVIVQGSHSRREKVADLLKKYGSGVDALKIPVSGGGVKNA